MFLHYSDLSAGWVAVADTFDWVVWGAFATEIAGSLALTTDRRGYVRRHRLAVFVVCFAFPPLPEVFNVVPGLYVIGLFGGFQLVQTAKLTETSGVVRAALARSVWWTRLAWGLFVLVTAVIVVAVIGVMVDADRARAARTPLHYTSTVLVQLARHPDDARVMVLGVVAVLFLVGSIWVLRPGRTLRAATSRPARPSPRSGR